MHYDLGLVYLEAGAFAEADSEFDTCLKRRGEVLELFMDDMPTYSYLPLVYYYQGRAREGLKSPGFADSYRTYLNIREKAGEDPFASRNPPPRPIGRAKEKNESQLRTLLRPYAPWSDVIPRDAP